MLAKTKNKLMQFYSLPNIKVNILLLQHHALPPVVLHLQHVLDILSYLPLLLNLGLMNLSNLYSSSGSEILMIYHLSQAQGIHLTPTFPRSLIMADLAKRHIFLPKKSLRRSLMFGLSWRLREMEESTVCFASM